MNSIMNKDNHGPSHFGLESAGRDEAGRPRLSADGGETRLPVPMSEDEYENLVADILGWMEQDELSAAEEARLREILYMGVVWEAENAHGGDLLEEAISAIRFAEAVMSEDVLNAVTGDYAADHCIYEAIGKLKDVLERHEREVAE